MQDYIFKTDPYAHQREAFLLSRDRRDFALLMDMGTGKTKVGIDTAAYLWAAGAINCLVVVAPNGIQENWIDREIPVHLPDWVPRKCHVWNSTKIATKKGKDAYESAIWARDFDGLRIMAVNVEAFGVNPKWYRTKDERKPKIGTEIDKIVNAFRTLIIVDESTKIKGHSANRSERLWHIGGKAEYRRIMTGSPVTNSPLDVYGQFMFLGSKYLNQASFLGFRNRYAIVRMEENRRTGKMFPLIVGYRRLDELHKLIDAVSFRVTKDECLDLPEKVYVRRTVEMAPEQAKHYKSMRDRSLIELRHSDEKITAQNILTKLLRLQQILGGFIPTGVEGEVEPIFETPETNPRIRAVLDVIEETSSRVIIWARFRAEIKALIAAISAEYGEDSVVSYYGGTSKEERAAALFRFQGERPIIDPQTHQRTGFEKCPDENRARFLVGNQNTGGYGLTLTEANLVVYYSNDFSLETRLQSEDRPHRIGQKNAVTYIDVEVPDTLDGKIIKALRAKLDIASQVTRDNIGEWL